MTALCRHCGRIDPQEGDRCRWSQLPCVPDPEKRISWEDLWRKPEPTPRIHHLTTSEPATPQLAGLLRTMAAAQEGERNSILHWAGCRLAEGGYGPTSVDALADVARETGLGDKEIQRTLESAGAIS